MPGFRNGAKWVPNFFRIPNQLRCRSLRICAISAASCSFPVGLFSRCSRSTRPASSGRKGAAQRARQLCLCTVSAEEKKWVFAHMRNDSTRTSQAKLRRLDSWICWPDQITSSMPPRIELLAIAKSPPLSAARTGTPCATASYTSTNRVSCLKGKRNPISSRHTSMVLGRPKVPSRSNLSLCKEGLKSCFTDHGFLAAAKKKKRPVPKPERPAMFLRASFRCQKPVT